MVYDYTMTGDRIHQSSMEAGDRWMLNDAAGNAIRAFDSRGHNLRTEYDALRRPINLFVLGTGGTNSEPRDGRPAMRSCALTEIMRRRISASA